METPEDLAGVRRPRADLTALTFAGMLGAGGLLVGLAWLVPGVLAPRPWTVGAALAVVVAQAVWVAVRGRVTPRSAHVLAVATLAAGNALIACVDDVVMRTAIAGWELMITLPLVPHLGRRAVAVYGTVCAVAGALQVGLLPGPWPLAVLRGVALAGPIAMTLGFVVGLRTQLDRVLADARDQALTDALTGLLNRRGLVERFAPLLLSARAPGSVAVISLDLDHFKRVNDSLGHTAGDAVLVAVARALDDAVDHRDLVVRLGGEELCVVAVVDDAAAAAALGEHLRLEVRRAAGPWGLTTSVGVSLADRPGPGGDAPWVEILLADLLEEADQCLYTAKAGGRDRVVGPRPPAAVPASGGGAGPAAGGAPGDARAGRVGEAGREGPVGR